MEQSKIDIFTSAMSDKLPSTSLMAVRSQLERVDDGKFTYLQSLNYKNPTTLLIFSLFFGRLGIDRFVLGEVGLGLLKLFTCGGLGIWTLVDWFIIMNKTKEMNLQLFMQNAH